MGDDPRSALGPSVATRALGAGKRPLAGREEAGAAGAPGRGRNREAGIQGLSLGPLRASRCPPHAARGTQRASARDISGG